MPYRMSPHWVGAALMKYLGDCVLVFVLYIFMDVFYLTKLEMYQLIYFDCKDVSFSLYFASNRSFCVLVNAPCSEV